MIVTLSSGEVMQAALVGVMRRLWNLRRASTEIYGAVGDAWGVDIEGACAEMAVAKLVHVYWQALSGTPQALPGDVGDLQVRSTTRPDGCLIVHPRDRDDALFVLVVGRAPRLDVVGTIAGADAKQPAWWRTDTGRPAYFVPQDALAAMEKAA